MNKYFIAGFPGSGKSHFYNAYQGKYKNIKVIDLDLEHAEWNEEKTSFKIDIEKVIKTDLNISNQKDIDTLILIGTGDNLIDCKIKLKSIDYFTIWMKEEKDIILKRLIDRSQVASEGNFWSKYKDKTEDISLLKFFVNPDEIIKSYDADLVLSYKEIEHTLGLLTLGDSDTKKDDIKPTAITTTPRENFESKIFAYSSIIPLYFIIGNKARIVLTIDNIDKQIYAIWDFKGGEDHRITLSSKAFDTTQVVNNANNIWDEFNVTEDDFIDAMNDSVKQLRLNFSKHCFSWSRTMNAISMIRV